MIDIQVNPLVDSIVMVENLCVGLLGSGQCKRYQTVRCSFDYYSFVFRQSPFHVHH